MLGRILDSSKFDGSRNFDRNHLTPMESRGCDQCPQLSPTLSIAPGLQSTRKSKKKLAFLTHLVKLRRELCGNLQRKFKYRKSLVKWQNDETWVS